MDEARFGFLAGSRAMHLRRLREEIVDVLIVGGGINGAGVARDLALRAATSRTPLNIGLVEQRHFASGTSGKNSQLIHGGLRYLKNLEFRLVREALHERAALIHLAPHLVEPLPFLIPMYGHFARLFYGTGLWLYDMLAGTKNIGRHRRLSRQELKRLEPELSANDLVSAAIFYDCRVHSSRFVLENLFDAAAHGAWIANYVKMESFSRGEDGLWRVSLSDSLSGERWEARARKLVDTCGPWGGGGSLRLVRGSHIVLPRIGASDNAIAYFEENGRIIFLIPWGSSRNLTLVGTTDVDHQDGPDRVRISSRETRYLLEIVRKLFPGAASQRPLSAYSSLRPLLRDESDSPTKTSREHKIWSSADGIVHVGGGKYTTYRVMSEEAADLACSDVAPPLVGLHRTAETPLAGNSKSALEALSRQADELADRYRLSRDELTALLRDYGVHAPGVLECVPASARQGLSRLQAAQLAHAVRHEMVQRLADLLFVSTYWGYEQAWDAVSLRPVACELGDHLGWDGARIDAEIALALQQVALPDA